jgi:hypothetical protein
MSKQKAIEKLRKLCDPNTLNVKYETNSMLSAGYYKVSTCTNQMTDKEILKAIKICRKHLINFHLYDGIIQWAHNESINATF